MTDETILKKLDEIIQGQFDLNLTIQGLKKDFENNTKNVEDRFLRIEAVQEENKNGHKWIHERIDKAVAESVAIEERMKVVETDPIFSEWKAIKKSLVKVAVGAVLSIIVILFLVNIPAILKYLAATKGISL